MAARRHKQGKFGDSEFAAARSHQDSLVSNENIRAASQAAILINGGAATALLAFLSKEKIAPYFVSHVPPALLGYALGVLCGAVMVFCSGRALKHWGLAWRTYMVDVKNIAASEKDNALANRWDRAAKWSFFGAMLCFVIASVWLACVLWYAQP